MNISIKRLSLLLFIPIYFQLAQTPANAQDVDAFNSIATLFGGSQNSSSNSDQPLDRVSNQSNETASNHGIVPNVLCKEALRIFLEGDTPKRAGTPNTPQRKVPSPNANIATPNYQTATPAPTVHSFHEADNDSNDGDLKLLELFTQQLSQLPNETSQRAYSSYSPRQTQIRSSMASSRSCTTRGRYNGAKRTGDPSNFPMRLLTASRNASTKSFAIMKNEHTK